jgi:hypothetical protein
MSNCTLPPNCWSNEDDELFTTYTYSTISTSGLLVCAYSICLFLIYKAKVPFVVKITIILLLSQLGACLTAESNILIMQTNPPLLWPIYYQALVSLLRDVCFNIGHWMFAFEYYVSAISMQYIFEQTSMPKDKKQRLNFLNKCMFAANCLTPLAYNFILWYTNFVSTRDTINDPCSTFNPLNDELRWMIPYFITRYSVGILQLVSGIFLLISVYIIRRFLLEHGLGSQTNHKNMIIHSLSFTLYNLAIIIYYIFFTIYETTPEYYDNYGVKTCNNPRWQKTWANSLIAWIVTTYTNFFAQLCLIWIFLLFRPRAEEEDIGRAMTVAELDEVRCSIVRIEEFDEPIEEKVEDNTESYLNEEEE